MKMRPLRDRILVERVEEQEQRVGGEEPIRWIALNAGQEKKPAPLAPPRP